MIDVFEELKNDEPIFNIRKSGQHKTLYIKEINKDNYSFTTNQNEALICNYKKARRIIADMSYMFGGYEYKQILNEKTKYASVCMHCGVYHKTLNLKDHDIHKCPTCFKQIITKRSLYLNSNIKKILAFCGEVNIDFGTLIYERLK